MTKDAALKLALEALEQQEPTGLEKWLDSTPPKAEQEPVLLQCTTCGTVYAEGVPPQVPEQEPVAWQWLGSAHFRKKLPKNADITAWNPLYTTPPKRKWVGLMDEETETLIHRFYGDPHTLLDEVNARLKKKNT